MIYTVLSPSSGTTVEALPQWRLDEEIPVTVFIRVPALPPTNNGLEVLLSDVKGANCK